MMDRLDRTIVIVGMAVFSGIAIVICIATASAQFLPRPPRDRRPDRAQEAYNVGRFNEAADILDGYVNDKPADVDARVLLGWTYYRMGAFLKAKAEFSEALRIDSKSDDARVGLGYTFVQLQSADDAAANFREVLSVRPNDADALQGMVLAGERSSSERVRSEALAASLKLSSITKVSTNEPPPGTEKRLRAGVDASVPLSVTARAIRNYIEVFQKGEWRPIFVKGINLGLALPGKFPAEFPRSEPQYAQWFSTIASLGANSVRVYTLLPPEFYKALKAYNSAHPDKHLWLIQGVWAELPPRYDFSDPAYVAAFDAETARVIDAIHGNLVLGPRSGHAHGVYNTDASESVLAYIIGREWEPFAVKEYNRIRRSVTEYHGKFLDVAAARPMECWVASVCEYAAAYEFENYRSLHPLTFANWPTLDPLVHPTESTAEEEAAWRRHFHLPAYKQKFPWEDDAVTLDATLVKPTANMPAGFFAAYHIYPNFPDFMNTDPAYDGGRDFAGSSRYAGYLAALKAYHGDQPVIVAEFGMSTSRGVAHVHPQGWNHGGVSEQQQGELTARMLRDIYDNKYAGGIVFEFLDEWFKSTWSVAPFESPSDRRRMWFNAESPEESYGILATRPAGARIVLDGKSSDWQNVPILMSD